MTINLFILIFICFIFLILTPIIILFYTRNNFKNRKIFMFIFSCFYFFVLIAGTICTIENQFPNLIFNFDFNNNWFLLKFLLFNFGISNILINIGMLIPIGFIVYSFSKNNNFLKIILLSIFISIFIELYQWVLPINRDTEIGDLIMNSFSGLISAIFCKILKKIKII